MKDVQKTAYTEILDCFVPITDIPKYNRAIREALDQKTDTIVKGNGEQRVPKNKRETSKGTGYRVRLQLTPGEMARVKKSIADLRLSAKAVFEEYKSLTATDLDASKIDSKSNTKRRIVSED